MSSKSPTAFAPIAGAIMVLALFTHPQVLAESRHPSKTTHLQSIPEPDIRRWDVEIQIGLDGTLDVRETQEIAFGDGPYQEGYRYLSARDIGGLRDVRVSESEIAYTESPSGEPNTYTATVESPFYAIAWHFPPTSGQTRTFVIEYTIVGGVEIERGIANRFVWDVIPSTHSDLIEVSNVSVRLPDGTLVDQRVPPVSYGVDAPLAISEGLVAFRTVDIPPERSFRIEVSFLIEPGTSLPGEAELAQHSGPNLPLIGLGLAVFLLLGIVLWLTHPANRPKVDESPAG